MKITMPVEEHSSAPIPNDKIFNPLRALIKTGFSFDLTELLHAVGVKAGALPESKKSKALRAAFLLQQLLEVQHGKVRFKKLPDSDFRSPRTQEIGVGVVCLLARQLWGFRWSSLEPIPGPGKRPDYRAKKGSLSAFFEAKGTLYRHKQSAQINDGVDKKAAHHGRGERAQIELTFSTHIGTSLESARIVVGDPPFDQLKWLSEEMEPFFALRHYSRALHFAGATLAALKLRVDAAAKIGSQIRLSSASIRELQSIQAVEYISQFEPFSYDGTEYRGRWFESWTEDSPSNINRSSYQRSLPSIAPIRIFQGISSATFKQTIDAPETLSNVDRRDALAQASNQSVSIFGDGTILVIEREAPVSKKVLIKRPPTF